MFRWLFSSEPYYLCFCGGGGRGEGGGKNIFLAIRKRFVANLSDSEQVSNYKRFWADAMTKPHTIKTESKTNNDE